MMKRNRYKILISSVVTLLPLVFGLLVWDKLPEKIATSFGWNGEVTGYSGKMFTVLGIPLILAFLNLICVFATSEDPKKKNIDDKVVSVVLGIVPTCSLICGACIYGNALGYTVHIDSIMPVFLGVIILILGLLLPKCKQNYTIGIRLPWTLHDAENWDKTHQFAGKLWIVGGGAMVIAGLLEFKVLFFILVFAIVIIPTMYSYLLHRNK